MLGSGLSEFGYHPADSKRFASADREPKPRDLSEKDKSLTTRMEARLREITDRLGDRRP